MKVVDLIDNVKGWVKVVIIDKETKEPLDSNLDEKNGLTPFYFNYNVESVDYNPKTKMMKIFVDKTQFIILCNHCIDAIESRGEHVIVLEEIDDNFAPYKNCEWCETDEHGTLYICTF